MLRLQSVSKDNQFPSGRFRGSSKHQYSVPQNTEYERRKWKPIRNLKSPNLNFSGCFQQRQGQSSHGSGASLLSLNMGSQPGSRVFLRDGTARFVPALLPLDTPALDQDPPKHCFCHSIIRIVYPIRSMLLVKLEKTVVAWPVPCSASSDSEEMVTLNWLIAWWLGVGSDIGSHWKTRHIISLLTGWTHPRLLLCCFSI